MLYIVETAFTMYRIIYTRLCCSDINSTTWSPLRLPLHRSSGYRVVGTRGDKGQLHGLHIECVCGHQTGSSTRSLQITRISRLAPTGDGGGAVSSLLYCERLFVGAMRGVPQLHGGCLCLFSKSEPIHYERKS